MLSFYILELRGLHTSDTQKEKKSKKRITIFHKKELEYDFEKKDIWVILDAPLKLDEQISTKFKEANAIAGLIRGSLSYLDGPFFKKLFTMFARPHLEYGLVIWAP